MKSLAILYIFLLLILTGQGVVGASVLYSSDFSKNNNGWIAHGGKWKWQKAPVKNFNEGSNAIYVDGNVKQLYLIKTFPGLKVTNAENVQLKLRLKIDSKTPLAYIACTISQGKHYVAKNRVRMPVGEWFEWTIPLTSMIGPGKKRFDPSNGNITQIKLFSIKRKTAAKNEIMTMYLGNMTIVKAAGSKIPKVNLTDWHAPSVPVTHPETLYPLLTNNAGKPFFLLDKTCTITVPATITDLADELNTELAKTLGRKLKVIGQEGKNSYYIYISRIGSKELGAVSNVQGESFRLIVNKKGILLQANTEAGLVNGIYELLHGLGYRWYMPGKLGECLPPNKIFHLKMTDKRISPKWEMRFIWYSWWWVKSYHSPASLKDFALWSRRNHIKNHTNYLAYHNFYRVFPKKKYFKAHPEYFSLIKGKRVAGTTEGQICATNSDVISILAQSAIASFQKNNKLKGYSLTTNDNPFMCQCENCRKYQDPSFLVNTRTYAYGYPEGADLHIWMMNQVRNLISSEFPDKHLVTIVNYDNISRPPRHINPDKHLVFGFTTMPCCKLHALDDKNCPVNREFFKLFKAWEKFGNPMYLRDYDPIVYWKGLPSLLTTPIYNNLKYCGSTPTFLGFNTEAHRSWATNTPNYYLKARLGWKQKSPNLQKIMDNYFIMFFGPAAKEMKNYYSQFAYLLQNSSLHPVARDLDNTILELFTVENITVMSDVLSRAEQACPEGSKYGKRVALLKMNFDYLKLYVKMLQYINEGKSSDAISVIGQMKTLVAELDSSNSSAIVKKYVDEELDKISESLKRQQNSKKGKNVVIDLNKCSFKTDPDKLGVKKQWFGVNYSAATWKDISLTASWEKQGYDYNGTAWYRKKFVLPLGCKGKDLLLYVGALDEEGVFYINGKKVYIRKHLTKDSWKLPFEFSVSKYLNYGSENVIAISVIDTAGAGGIWKGMFLYYK